MPSSNAKSGFASSLVVSVFPRFLHLLLLLTLLSRKNALFSLVSAQMDESARNATLVSHNSYRSQLAQGEVQNGQSGQTLPKGANICEMRYDMGLEQIAQAWANNCKFAHSGRKGVGENIFYYTALLDPSRSVGMACTMWWQEAQSPGFSSPQNVVLTPSEFNRGIGHFTQMGWGKSQLVGCGSKYCPDQGFTLVVCNYSPQGNYLNEPMYETGEPCSQCQADYSPQSNCTLSQGLCQTPPNTPTAAATSQFATQGGASGPPPSSFSSASFQPRPMPSAPSSHISNFLRASDAERRRM